MFPLLFQELNLCMSTNTKNELIEMSINHQSTFVWQFVKYNRNVSVVDLSATQQKMIVSCLF